MLTPEEFSLFRNLIYLESGLSLRETKKEFLEYRLLKRMKATETATPYWYYRFVLEHRKAELPLLLELLTINETSFFRNPPQIELLRRTVLPELLRRKEQSYLRRLRIWSAGCSTGEEPYTIAIETLEVLGAAQGWDVRIFASDLNRSVLECAHRGRYDAEKMRETVPAELLQKYFVPVAGAFEVREIVRRPVVFDLHNLKHENGLQDLDIIFCRNVMIYFDDDEQRRLIDKLYRSLGPGGYLFLGHSESLHGLDERFEFVIAEKGSAYRKPRGDER
jgi:chemotaxis protein methyltransferase CheR